MPPWWTIAAQRGSSRANGAWRIAIIDAGKPAGNASASALTSSPRQPARRTASTAHARNRSGCAMPVPAVNTTGAGPAARNVSSSGESPCEPGAASPDHGSAKSNCSPWSGQSGWAVANHSGNAAMTAWGECSQCRWTSRNGASPYCARSALRPGATIRSSCHVMTPSALCRAASGRLRTHPAPGRHGKSCAESRHSGDRCTLAVRGCPRSAAMRTASARVEPTSRQSGSSVHGTSASSACGAACRTRAHNRLMPRAGSQSSGSASAAR